MSKIKEVAVVIGANFGDCGKGLATQQFCKRFKSQGLNPIVVCHNGGSQKGHTVINDGIRHVFGHFGSGSLIGCPTYLSKEYIINPIIFRREYEQLATKGVDLDGKVYVNSRCRITTPFEMFLNDMKERKRGANRHGSCGLGIYETVKRNIRFNIDNCCDMNSILRNLQWEFTNVVILKELLPFMEDYMSGCLLDSILMNYKMDVAWMLQHIKVVEDEKELLESFDSIVFEGAQGLMLDQNNMEYFPHLTPSNTGSTNPHSILKHLDVDANIEACYVTRSYLTRHGAGWLENECRKEDINPNMIDKTNVPNDYQGTLRYGFLDVNTLEDRVNKDFKVWDMPNITKSLMITHLNEYKLKEYPKSFDVIYQSYDETTQVI